MPIHDPRTNVELRLAWRRKDPAIERDAELFWRKEQLLPKDADVGTRLGELCMAGYDGDELIALSTARIRYIDFLGVKLAMVRIATARDKRKNAVGLFLLAQTREKLEEWSAANPQEAVMGMGTITQTREWDERGPARAFGRDARLGFIGWTANNEQMRVAWFDHGTIPRQRPNAPFPSDT